MSDVSKQPEVELIPEEELVPADDAIIGVAVKWSIVALLGLGVTIGLIAWLTRGGEQPEVLHERNVQAPERLNQEAPDMPSIQFADVTREAGIDFVHESGARGQKLLPETMGGGCAFFDYDGDDDQDLLFVNSMPWPEDAESAGATPTMRLYANDGKGKFSDVTTSSGLDITAYGMGAATGDFDNDGDVDLFFANLGSNILMRNNGDGTFTDATTEAGVAGEKDRWSSSAGFFDYDNDGLLDLFVCNYVEWSREIDIQLNYTLNGRDRAYGPPLNYKGTHSYLYHNRGDGTFEDVSKAAGIEVANPARGEPMGKALAVAFVDVDRNGWLDIFVANDTVQNFLFRNNGDGTFTEVGAAAGVAFDNAGGVTGAMGIDTADYRNDGTIAVAIGNFSNEPTSLYLQQPGNTWQFADVAGAEGVGSPSRLRLKFGLLFFDGDLDGRLDLFQANGHLEDEIHETQESQTYEQPAQLFWNCGVTKRGCFALMPDDRVGDLSRPIVGRGASCADIDGDGDLDLVITQTGAAPLLLRNNQSLGHHWLRIKLSGTKSNRDAIGAEVELVAGGVTQRRVVTPTRSYLSQAELPVTFGLGSADRVEALTITWPGGQKQSVTVAAVDTTLHVTQTE